MSPDLEVQNPYKNYFWIFLDRTQFSKGSTQKRRGRFDQIILRGNWWSWLVTIRNNSCILSWDTEWGKSVKTQVFGFSAFWESRRDVQLELVRKLESNKVS